MAKPSGETPGLAQRALDGPMKHVEEIVYAVRGPGREWHFYGNFGARCQNPNGWLYGRGPGRLVRLNVRTKERKVIFEDPDGAIRDPDVHYSGEKILFSYRKGGSHFYHLYEINIDGSGLKQLTDGPWDDMEAVYLPNGEIIFCSSRCRRYVPCLNTQVAILYKCDADGANIRRISANVETESTPAVMADGRVIFMRWEYVHRGVMAFHHLWTINPDGTGQMTFYGNMRSKGYAGMRENVLMTEPRSIPGTDKVSAIFCDTHGRSEHRGHLVVIDPKDGPDAVENSRRINTGFPNHPNPKYDIPQEAWRDPYPFSEDCFLLASYQGIYIMDGQGRFELLFQPPGNVMRGTWIHEPRPLLPREREPIIPKRTDWSEDTATLMLNQVHVGRNMKDVKPGDVKKLLILEVLPTPTHFGTGNGTLGSVHNLRRVIGTVPVAADGSAHFSVPARRALVFVALDENWREVKRMNSFVNLMPGEKTACVGCHERRTLAPPPIAGAAPLAALTVPAKPKPVAGVPDIIDFNRDVQPILNKHCVKCYNRENDQARAMTGERYGTFSDSYHALRLHARIGGSNNDPYSTGTARSKVLQILDEGHKKVKLSEIEMQTLRMWVASGGAYAGTYAANTYDAIQYLPMDRSYVDQHCNSCHKQQEKDERRRKRFVWPGTRRNADLINLSHPERSRILRQALAKDAGGLATVEPGGKSSKKDHVILFRSTDDPGYQELKEDVEGLIDALHKIGWYGTTNWRPNEHYIREMKRYGVLPQEFDIEKDPFDPFETDRRYFEKIYNDSPYPRKPDDVAESASE